MKTALITNRLAYHWYSQAKVWHLAWITANKYGAHPVALSVYRSMMRNCIKDAIAEVRNA